MSAAESEYFMPTAEVRWEVLVAGAANSFYIGSLEFSGAKFGLEYYPREDITVLVFIPPCCGVKASWEERRDCMKCETCGCLYYLYNEPSINSVYSSITFNTNDGKGEEPHPTQLACVERFLHYWDYNPLEATLYGSDLLAQMEELSLSLPHEGLRHLEPVVWAEWRRRVDEGVMYSH